MRQKKRKWYLAFLIISSFPWMSHGLVVMFTHDRPHTQWQGCLGTLQSHPSIIIAHQGHRSPFHIPSMSRCRPWKSIQFRQNSANNFSLLLQESTLTMETRPLKDAAQRYIPHSCPEDALNGWVLFIMMFYYYSAVEPYKYLLNIYAWCFPSM